ncbi:MAG: extracellular solute-binding protein [Candidatus Omnitrophota bacterium]|jgi:ABC-type glycerol-3-phosphate transport system substrate-binding protein
MQAAASWGGKRILGLLVFVFIAFIAGGCSSGISDTRKAPGEQLVTVWHWMTDRQAGLEELGKRYTEKTGVKVNFELYAPSDAYTQKVRAAAHGQNLPDIFGILAEKRDFASFIKAGHVADLTSYVDADGGKWRERFFPKALAVNEFLPSNSFGVKAGIYGVPIDVSTIQMVFNKDLLKQIGGNPEKPPVTFDEFLALGPKIKGAGLQGLVSGWAEIWMIDCLANNYAFNIMGKDKVMSTLRGEVPYTDPDWIRVFGLFKKMQDSGILANGIVTMINKTSEQLFANGKAVFAFNGSWGVNVYKNMNPNLNYGVMLPPKASEKYPMAVWGGAGSSFLVSERSKNKEETIKFLEWLTDRDQQAYLSEVTNNLPANKECLTVIPGPLAQFADDMDFTTHPNTWDVSEFPAVTEAFNKGIQRIILGEKTPEQIGREVQEVKERELAKNNKQQ